MAELPMGCRPSHDLLGKLPFAIVAIGDQVNSGLWKGMALLSQGEKETNQLVSHQKGKFQCFLGREGVSSIALHIHYR